MHRNSNFHFWFPYLYKLLASGFLKEKNYTVMLYASILTVILKSLANFNQAQKSSRDLRHNYFPTDFRKMDKPSTGKTSCYCLHRERACSSAFITLNLHRRGTLRMLLNAGNVSFIVCSLLDITESNHKTCSKCKLEFLSPAAHGSIS